MRTTNPENRVDLFFEIQYNKIEQILHIAVKNECDYILQAGDIMDNPRPSFELIEKYVSLFRKYKIGENLKILHVWGQHDMRFRTKERTATKLFNFLGYLEEVNGVKKLSPDIDLYGCSWGDEIPKIEYSIEDKFNILLIHATIADKPQWVGHEDFLKSDTLFKKHPFDIILCGDNHHPVFYENKSQMIVGCGCIVRKTIAESDLIPHVYILDIEEKDLTYNLKKVELKYEPADKVFKQEALERETSKDNKKMQEFISSIKNNSVNKNLDFKKNLENLLISTEQQVKEIIMKELENLNE